MATDKVISLSVPSMWKGTWFMGYFVVRVY